MVVVAHPVTDAGRLALCERRPDRHERIIALASDVVEIGQHEDVPSQHPQLNDPDWLRRQYLELDRTRRDMAREVGCAPSTVGDALRKYGIRKRGTHRPAADAPGDWLREAYEVRERSLADIAREIGVAPRTVRRALVEAGIAIRNEGRPVELDDLAWCEERQHESPKALALTLSCTPAAVRRAMQRHGLRPLRGADDLPYPQLADAQWLSAQHHDAGLTHAQIAALVGCSRTAVTQAMQRLGVSSRPPGRVWHPLLSDAVWLTEQVANGRTITEIAVDLGCDWKSVREALDRNGVTFSTDGRQQLRTPDSRRGR